jgi:hypothetical protein
MNINSACAVALCLFVEKEGEEGHQCVFLPDMLLETFSKRTQA